MNLLRKESRALEAMFQGQGEDGKPIQFSVDTQMTGHLWKKATSNRRRWSRRYFVLKDGFLMYYPERRRGVPFHTFDFHPKGVLPLDSCSVSRVQDGPKKSMKFSFGISHPSFGGRSLILCAESIPMLDKWMTAIENCRFITYKNALIGAQQMDKLKEDATGARTRLQLVASQYELKAQALRQEREKFLAVEALASKLSLQTKMLQDAIASVKLQHGIALELPDLPFTAADATELESLRQAAAVEATAEAEAAEAEASHIAAAAMATVMPGDVQAGGGGGPPRSGLAAFDSDGEDDGDGLAAVAEEEEEEEEEEAEEEAGAAAAAAGSGAGAPAPESPSEARRRRVSALAGAVGRAPQPPPAKTPTPPSSPAPEAARARGPSRSPRAVSVGEEWNGGR